MCFLENKTTNKRCILFKYHHFGRNGTGVAPRLITRWKCIGDLVARVLAWLMSNISMRQRIMFTTL
jgi:hypothetical protein